MQKISQMTDIIIPQSPLSHILPIGSLDTTTTVPSSPCTKHTANAIELCCGSANWSAALRKQGIEAIGVDFERNPQKPAAPIVNCDLSTLQGQTKVLELDSEMKFDVLHAAPPCGTASRARERPLPASLVKQGIPTPRQLRSNQFPEGLPSLTGNELMRVTLENKIYTFVLQMCIDRHKNKRLFSLENPDTSYFWLVPLAIVLLMMPGVKCVIFAQCLHGGSRPVMRRWVSNIPGMETLAGGCPGQSKTHVHLAFGAAKQSGIWKFATAEEATYPVVLCNKTAKIAAAALQSRGIMLQLDNILQSHTQASTKRHCVRAEGGKFVRGNKLPPIISEFLTTANMLIPTTAQSNDTIPLQNSHKGKVLRITGEPTGEPSFRQAAVGVYRNPKEFVDAAWEICHPIDMISSLPEVLLRNIFWLITTSTEDIRLFRTKALQTLRLKAAELAVPNAQIHSSLPPEMETVLKDKHFKLMEWALQQAGYADTAVVTAIISGTPLTGTVQRSGIFPERLKPASLDKDELLKSTPTTRRLIIDSIRSSGDEEIDTAVWQETLIEIEKGWLSKPMSEQQIEADVGNLFTVARRFGIKQGGKVRAIDDYSEHGTNATVTTSERIDLLGTDELFLLAKHVAASIREDGTVLMKLSSGETLTGKIPPGKSPSEARKWLGKTFDLKAAYRQLATAEKDGNRRFCVVGVFCPTDKRTHLFLQYGTPFGSVASVYYFNRAARALWAIGTHFLKTAWTNYFDDYPTIEPACSAVNCDLSTKAMFAILGWELSLDPKKAKGFESEFNVLGVIADLSKLPECTAIYRNKPERVRDICEIIDAAILNKRFPQPLMAEVRGKAQYAASQVFGRLAIGPLHVMAQHQYSSKTGHLDAVTLTALTDIKHILCNTPPRSLSCLGETRPLLLFTDGAAEGEDRGQVTCGGVLIDTASDFSEMFGGRIPAKLVKAWKADGQKLQVIGQAELLPIALSRRQWRERLRHRRLIAFVDNDSARQSLCRGWSPSASSRSIIRDMLEAEITDQVWIWYARVPTHSNPADDPSRLILVPSEDNDYANIIPMPAIPDSLFPDR